MVYKVIGLMSGSSLDGLDIAYVQLEEVRGKWNHTILQAECAPYAEEWGRDLRSAASLDAADYFRLHTRYGHYLGQCVRSFMQKYDLEHKVHFIASHGHTVFHEPATMTTVQAGDGAAIAAGTGLPVISDLRNIDVALGGQGAPIVPIGDKLLFAEHDYLLNIGGIANITVRDGERMLAFDVCPANQVLNGIAEREGRPMDEGGGMAARGMLLPGVLDELDSDEYYLRPAPKSLSNDMAMAIAFPRLLESEYNNYDLLHTMAVHIARQVAAAVRQYPHSREEASMLVTGGGAFNHFLVAQLERELAACKVKVQVPDAAVIKYKEALVMALIGVLRWREEANVLRSVTGAQRDSVGGALWLG